MMSTCPICGAMSTPDLAPHGVGKSCPVRVVESNTRVTLMVAQLDLVVALTRRVENGEITTVPWPTLGDTDGRWGP